MSNQHSVSQSTASPIQYFSQSIKGVYDSLNAEIAPVASRIFDSSVARPLKTAGSYLGRIIRPVALGLSRIATSVSGLSDILKAAVMADALFRSMSSIQENERAICSRFNEYRTVVDATRILEDPSYYFGDDLDDDLKKSRWFSIASSVMGTAISIYGCAAFIFDHEIKPSFLKNRESGRLQAIDRTRSILDRGFGIASVISSSLGAVELIRDILRGKSESIQYSSWRVCAKVADALHTALEIMPVKGAPVLTASLGLISASCGIVSFFLKPQE